MTNRLTLETAIEKFRSVHGDRYNYSRVVWQDRYAKIIVVCPEHGAFETDYNLHALSKSGCNKCGLQQRKMNPFTADEIEYLISTYETSMTKEELQKALPNHTWGSICDKAKKLGLSSIRKHQRKDQLSHVIEPTNLNAYLWGLIYADGHLSRAGGLQVGLWKKDQSYLEKLSKIFKLGAIKSADGIGTMIKVEVYDKENVTKLKAHLDYHDRKTYNPPSHFDFLESPKMRLSFLIGLSDGDGCLTFDHNKTFKHLRIIQHHNWYPFVRDLTNAITVDTGLRFTTNDTNARQNSSLYMGGKQQHQYLIDFIEDERLPVLERKWYNKQLGYNKNPNVNDQKRDDLKIL